MPDQPNRWVLAARPATLWASISPVLIGSALAANHGVFRWDAFVVIMAAAIAIQVAVNFANDVADAAKGADTAERLGPKRAVASGLISPAAMWRGIAATLAFAVLCGLYLAWLAGWVIIAIGVVSLLAAFGYTNGPYPYGYRGFGELFVFVFFGLVATVGTRYVFDRSAPVGAWVLAISMGMFASAILVANNVRDAETDAHAGKRTLAVLLGSSVSRRLYAAMIAAAFAMVPIGVIGGWIPAPTLLALGVAPLAIRPLGLMASAPPGPQLVAVLIRTGQVQAAFALTASVGVLIG
ncbi:MAG: 1,4-dihydroxy-2-naphthoate polyprenyltransferase [Acidimicrobiia bacterium]|nr:1,4-dihydroxy-2-naphthoate polyprenyltransferase [Acidimicrobiia bacterium]